MTAKPTVLQQATGEYKKLYHCKFGILLSDNEATKQTTDFINLFRVLLKSPVDTKNETIDNLERI